MIVYRIAHKNYVGLDGIGGLYGQGRWHLKGNLVIYTSEHASLAAWEKLVHITSLKNLPQDLLLLKISLPDTEEILNVSKKTLTNGWNGYPFSQKTMDFGTSFLKNREHLALRVPSVVIPDEHNIILNPLHPGFNTCEIISKKPFTFDRRIS